MTPDGEHNLLDYVFVVAKWRRMITVTVALVTLASVGISFVLPETWTAQTKLLPPEAEHNELELALLLGSAIPAGLRGLAGGSGPAERLLTLLVSNRLLGAVADEFSLQQEFGVVHREEAIDLLREQIESELGGDGTLTIRLTARSAQRAADLCNGLARHLDLLNLQYKQQQARDLAGFLAKRLELAHGDIEESARSLLLFQEEHGLVAVEAQTAASVEVVKNIVLQLAELEVELDLMRQQLRGEHEEKMLLELKVRALREQLLRIQGDPPVRNGAPMQSRAADLSTSAEALESLGPPLRNLPQLMFENAKLTLDVKIHEEIIRFLGTKFEEAKYREALNTPTLQVLDIATPPLTRSGPRRTLMVIGAFAVSLVLSTFLAFLLESWNRLGRENEAQLSSIRDELAGK